MFKVENICSGWVAQVAGRHDSCREVIEFLRQQFGAGNFVSNTAFVSAVNAALEEFHDSPLYEKYCCELLLSGFINNKAVIGIVRDYGEGLVPYIDLSFAVIGSGANIATVILNCRDYHSLESFEHALYLVYEAKRLSEKADGVGPGTVLMWMGQGHIGAVSDAGLQYLEDLFEHTGLKANFVINLPPNFFGKSDTLSL
jgi:hypothetical protein